MPAPGSDPVKADALATALQPLNVQMAELVEAVKALNGAATGAADATAAAAAGGLSMNQALSALNAGLRTAAAAGTVAFTELTRFTGAVTSTVGRFVEAFAPVHMQRFALAARDTAAAVGQILVPVLDRFRLVARAVGDTIVSLSPSTRQLLAALAAGGVAMAAMTAATVAFSTAVNSATFGVSAVVGALAGVAVGTGILSGTMGQFQQALRGVADSVRPILDAVGEGFRRVVEGAQPLFAVFARLAERAAGPLTQVVRQLAGSLASFLTDVAGLVASAAPLLLQVGQAFQRLNAALLGLAVAALEPVLAAASALMPVVQLLLTPLTAGLQLFSALAGVVGGVLGPALDVLLLPLRLAGELFGAVAAEVQGALDELFSALGEVAALAGEVARELAAAFKGLFGDVVRPLLDVFMSGLRVVTGVIRDVAAAIGFLVAELRDLLGLPAAQPGPAGSSAGMAFVQTRTDSTEGMLRRLQENAFGLGKGADPQRETAKNTGTMALLFERLLKEVGELPGEFADKLAEKLKDRAQQAGDALTGAAMAPWQAAREVAGRVFG